MTKNKKAKKNNGGIKIKKIHCTAMICSSLLCIALLITVLFTRKNYSKMFSSMHDYSECNKAINEFRDTSDYLSNQARLFAINLDKVFMHNYVEEYTSYCRREKAVEIVELSHVGDEPDIKLKMAYKESQALAQIELYDFKLIVTALKLPDHEVPEVIRNITLNPLDKALTSDQMLEKARYSLFDSLYLHSKERIIRFTAESLNSLVYSYLREERNGDIHLRNLFFASFVGIIILFILTILVFYLIIFLVLSPLQRQVKNVELGKRMDVCGSYETRYIASTYNSLIEKTEIKTSILKHKAEHDSLTGLINRDAFEQIKKILSESAEPIAYLILDIDFFKAINDTHGHLVGDEVLKKIAFLLLDKFRNTDYIARIGGDEFAIIMTKFGNSPEQVIQAKIDALNKTLQNVSDGLPSVSLSVGVSFSSCGFLKEMEAQADKALYKVKKGGRCNCSFYNFQDNDDII